MESVVHDLATHLDEQLQKLPSSRRLLVGISGVPASGKSTLATHVVAALNATNGTEVAVVVGLDGWHYSRAHLDTMPDPLLAHARRGAHWTFDGASYVAFVRQLALNNDEGAVCRAPSFDHAQKDPVADDVAVLPQHRVVVCEGLYVFLDVEPWRAAGLLLHERWFIDVPDDVAVERLVRRHVRSGICEDEQSARVRAVENDMPNGKFVREHLLEPTRRIVSTTDATWTY